jgi:hypothetical protein
VRGPLERVSEPLQRRLRGVLQDEILDSLFSVHEEAFDLGFDRFLGLIRLFVAQGKGALAKTLVELGEVCDLAFGPAIDDANAERFNRSVGRGVQFSQPARGDWERRRLRCTLGDQHAARQHPSEGADSTGRGQAPDRWPRSLMTCQCCCGR